MSEKKNIGKNAQSSKINISDCITGKPNQTNPDTQQDVKNVCKTEKQRKEESKDETIIKETIENSAAIKENENNSRIYSAEEIAAMIAEAEDKGYRRGRNANIEELMRRPGIMERDTATGCCNPTNTEAPLILNRQHISIWDK